MKTVNISLKNIETNNNIRGKINDTDIPELAASIKSLGLRNPIEVEEIGKNKYRIITGHRRYAAHKFLKLEGIEAFVRNIKEEDIPLVQLAENIHRKDMDPLDEATAFEGVLKSMKSKDAIKEISKRIGKTEYYVAVRLKLNKLTDQWKKAFKDGIVNLSVLSEVIKLSQSMQKEAYTHLLRYDNHITLKEIESYIKRQSMNLNVIPWDAKSKEFKVQKACEGCSERADSVEQQGLFPDQKVSKICLNGNCFAQKLFETKVSIARKAVKDNVLLLSDRNYAFEEINILQKETSTKVHFIDEYSTREGSKGNIEGVYVDSDNIRKIGQRIKITLKKKESESVGVTASGREKKDPKELLERRIQLDGYKRDYEKFQFGIKTCSKLKIADSNILLTTLIFFGVEDQINSTGFPEFVGNEKDSMKSYLNKLDPKLLLSNLLLFSQIGKLQLKYPEFCGTQGFSLFVKAIKPWYAHHKDIMVLIDKEWKKIDEEHEAHVKKMKDRFKENHG